MKQFRLVLILAIAPFFFKTNRLFSQNTLVTIVPPDFLYVCGIDETTVFVKNTSTSTLSGVSATVTLPPGIRYVPNTVNGASEQSTSNLSVPVFDLPDLAPDAEQTFTFQIRASCALIPAINTGQLFSNKVKITSNLGAEEVSSASYTVETGLLQLISAQPTLLEAEKGDTVMRTIVLRNTRLGPIERIFFSDFYESGMSVEVLGGTNVMAGSTWLECWIDSAIISQFGDGDALFEFGEEITLTEKITVTECMASTLKNTSEISISWGCGNTSCQTESVEMEVNMLASTRNPSLSFKSVYGYPTDYCGGQPSTNILIIKNEGSLPAFNVLLDFYASIISDSLTGMDPNSFEYSNDLGGTWLPLTVTLGTAIPLGNCGTTYYYRVLTTLPVVPADTTVWVRYKVYSCVSECDKSITSPGVYTFYTKQCPPNAPVAEFVDFFIDPQIIGLQQLTEFDIGECLKNGENYQLTYIARTKRFLTDTGYFQARIVMPIGIEWDSSCTAAQTLDGKQPVFTSTETDPFTGQTTLLWSYKLPFSAEDVTMPLCIRYVCQGSMQCEDIEEELEKEGGAITAYPNKCGDLCALPTTTQASIALTPDAGTNCGLFSCNKFYLVVDTFCTGGSGGGGGGVGLADFDTYTIRTYRINYGLADINNDRVADGTGQADSSDVRLDRYMPGDTMRVDFRGILGSNSLDIFNVKVFTESLSSDGGLLGGDEYKTIDSRFPFINIDSLKLIRAFIRVKRTNGVEFECEAPVVDYKHRNLVIMEEINVLPAERIDEFTTMYKEFTTNILTCSPDNQPLLPGDSLIFMYEYAFALNFTPVALSGSAPALVNFRNTIWDSPKDYVWTYPDFVNWPRPMSQYSGYDESVTYPKHNIRPCTTSTQLAPFYYGIRLARDNMFTKEVRPLSKLREFRYTTSTDLTLLSATGELVLQPGITLLSDVAIPWTSFNDGTKALDYETALFTQILDEGWETSTDFVFDESCAFEGPDDYTSIITMEYPEGLPKDTVELYLQTKPWGFLKATPGLSLQFQQPMAALNTADFDIDFVLRDTLPAPATNVWLYVQPLNGPISDLQIIRTNTGTALPGVANLFQLGELQLLSQEQLRLVGTNKNCDQLQLRIIFGWDCEPVTNPSANSCGRDTAVLELNLNSAVLELDIKQQPAAIPLCEPSDYFEFEVSNANNGDGLGIEALVKLPQGLGVLPGTCQVRYPAGSGPWVSISNPTLQPGNIFLWKVADILPDLTSGLPGFNTSPSNAFRIRFKAQAECGFVANAQPIYGADGVQPCGTLTNSLRKPGDPIGLEGAGASYDVGISLSPVGNATLSCGGQIGVAVQLLLGSTPAAGDSVYITLPVGVQYVAGSYQPTQNTPSGAPLLVGNTLQVALQPGLPAGSVVKFNIQLLYAESAGCIDKFVTAQSRQKVEVFCATINQSCGVYIATGEALLPLPTANPDLKLALFQPALLPSGNGYGFTATIQNPGTVTATSAVLELWLDQNGNGLPDQGEQLLETLNYNQSIAPGATAIRAGTLDIPLSDLCKILAVLPAAPNCACADKYFPIDNLSIDQGTRSPCTLDPITLGITSTPGNTYQWQPTNYLSCTNCAMSTFTPNNTVDPGDFFTFVLLEMSGSCTLEHQFEVRFNEVFAILTPDLTICKGSQVILEAAEGGTYLWSGPNVVPNAQEQILTPLVTTTYSVTITSPTWGCTGTDAVTITVVDDLKENLPPLQICVGDTAMIFGEPQTQAGEYCKVIPGFGGCDTTRCVALSFFPAGGLPNDTTLLRVVEGGTVELNGPEGYATYEWAGFTEGLSCTDCQSPLATPPTQDTILYKVAVTNSGGCSDTAVYRVFVVPPCFEGIQLPNAFTPGNGGVNDRLEAVIVPEAFEKVVRLQVYNRWGQRIYDSSTETSWDGTVQGKPAPMDLYIIIFDVECNGEVRRMAEREVTLIR
jgi:gliding motility-associated-like protein